jgi:DNA repair exonuclease SbcCD ATPase subunit
MKVSIQNFRCFRKLTTYEIQNGKLTLLKGNSGAGKTTVLESIRWCLFGSLRGIYPTGFTPTQTNKTFVDIEILGLKITRSQAPESLVVLIPDYENNQYITITQDPAQKYVDSVFGNKSVWQASSFIRQNERCPLMTANNAERMSLLNEILFGSDSTSPFENPDYYTEKIEEELDKVSKEITGQTAIFNTYYSKYMSNAQSFENIYGWESMTTANIQGYKDYVDDIRKEISSKSLELLEISKLENKKKFLEDKLKTLQESNSNVNFEFITNVNDNVILNLTSSLSSIQTLLNKCLSDKTKYESLSNELNIQNSRMMLNHKELINQPVLDIETKVKNHKLLISELEIKLREVKDKEMKRSNFVSLIELEASKLLKYEDELKSFSISDVELLKKILSNSIIHRSLNEIQNKISNLNLTSEASLIPEYELNDNEKKLHSNFMNLKHSLDVCKKYGLNLIEVKTKIEAYQKLIDTSKIQKEHILNSKNFITKNEELEKLRKNLITDFSPYMEYLHPEEKEIDSVKITSLIELINTRLGSPLKCPHCSCVVEYINGVLIAPKNEIIDANVGKRRIEKLKELLLILNRNTMIESMISKTEAEISNIPAFDEAIINTRQYSDIEISSIQSLINECSRIETEFEEMNLSVIENKLEYIKKLREYYRLTAELNKLTSEFTTEIEVREDISKLQNEILTLPNLIQSINSIRIRKQDLESSLALVNIENLEPYEVLNQKLEETRKELKELEENLNSVSFSHRLQELISNIFSSMINIDITSITEENISKLEKQKESIQQEIIETKRTFELIKDYSKLKQEIRDIILITSSEIIQSQIQVLNENLTTYNDMYYKSQQFYNLSVERTELEKVRNLIIELTNKQSNLNIMKQIVIETTNSALEGLVVSINNTTNTVLEELFDDSMVIELKLYKELKTGKNKIKPSVNLCAYYKGECFDNINNLSGGEQSRISLALTLALASIHTSPIVFLDEVMGALNADLREQCVEVIKNFLIERSNKTILSVEHNFIVGLFDDSIEITHS